MVGSTRAGHKKARTACKQRARFGGIQDALVVIAAMMVFFHAGGHRRRIAAFRCPHSLKAGARKGGCPAALAPDRLVSDDAPFLLMMKQPTPSHIREKANGGAVSFIVNGLINGP